MIRTAELTITTKARCQLECLAMNEGDIAKFLDDASVNFGKSEPQKDPKIYRLEGTETNGLFMTFETRDSLATLVDVLKVGAGCPCQ